MKGPESPFPNGEFPHFFGNGLFGVIHRPQVSGPQGWVYCSPFGKERDNSQRLGFMWARWLASLGHWILRFDYRGTGDSSGSFSNYSLDDYLDDIAAAVARLEAVSGLPCRGVMGLRLGATLAAVFVKRFGRDLDLVLWEPIVSGKKYVDSLLRTAMANQMVHKGGNRKSRDDYRQEIEAGGVVEVDGFGLSEPMYSSLLSVDLHELGRPTAGGIQIVHLRNKRGKAVPSDLSQLSEKYSVGGSTRFDAVDELPVWLRTRFYAWDLDEVFRSSSSWIHQPPAGNDRSQEQLIGDPEPINRKGALERPVGFEVTGERVWGILHEPMEPRKNAPGVVFAAAGEACRSAFFYRNLARSLADRGWTVLRFDPRGIGDSHGHLDHEVLVDIFTSVENGRLVPDATAAVDFMEREIGCAKSVLIGLCGGAITAIRLAQTDERVVGIASLELPMRLTQPTDARKERKRFTGLPWHEALSRRQGTLFLLTLRRLYHLLKDHRRRAALWTKSTLFRRSLGGLGDPGWYRKQIGDDASVDVLLALKKTLSRRVQTYCVFADTEQPVHFRNVVDGLVIDLEEPDSILRWEILENADHNFTSGASSKRLTQGILEWLDLISERRPER